jgi:hypothetical protein
VAQRGGDRLENAEGAVARALIAKGAIDHTKYGKSAGTIWPADVMLIRNRTRS